jgi:hypothetical protein
VDPDLLIGPVEHRVERDNLAVLHLSEVGLDVVLGSIGTDHVGDRPLVPIGEEDPLAEDLGFECVPGLGVDPEGETKLARAVTGQRGDHDPG